MTRRRIIAGGGVAKRRAVIVTGWRSFVVGSGRSGKRPRLGHAAVRTWRRQLVISWELTARCLHPIDSNVAGSLERSMPIQTQIAAIGAGNSLGTSRSVTVLFGLAARKTK